MDPTRIKALWHRWDGERRNSLDRARKCARYTKPWLVPDPGMTDQHVLHEPFQLHGAMFLEANAGRMFLDAFTPGAPWFMLRPPPQIMYDPSMDPVTMRALDTELARAELAIIACLESVKVRSDRHARRRRSFYAAMYQICEMLVCTGDVLARMGDNYHPETNPVSDDYRVQVFPRDSYVTRRDSSGDVLDHIVREPIQPRELQDETLAKIGVELHDHPDQDTPLELYTHVEKQRFTGRWVIRQTVRDMLVAESDEAVSSFFSVPYELAPGCNYGRGPVEARIGGIGSLDKIAQATLDMAAMKTDWKVWLDQASRIRNADLEKGPGSVVRGARVSGGVVQDVAIMSAANTGDFSEVGAYYERLVQAFQQASQSHAGTQPRGDRVTRFQSEVIASEVDQSRIGGMINLEESLQIPILQRVIYQLRRDKILPQPLRESDVDFEPVLLAGMAQLRRAKKIGTLLNAVQLATLLGPQAQQVLDPAKVYEILLRYGGVYEPGAIKSPEQLRSEQQVAFNQAVAAEGAQEAISVAGDIARERVRGAVAAA